MRGGRLVAGWSVGCYTVVTGGAAAGVVARWCAAAESGRSGATRYGSAVVARLVGVMRGMVVVGWRK